eukprot:Seg2129.1 transcript_id=Seg2129.1/GoldUCD/mRNA.D3Y31 product="HemK methyltransferase family member 2" protein_id=Seg2129.1/GoldUCD/D3Y31
MAARKDILKTPIYSHLKKFSEDVYEPAEDTFLLLDALEADISLITKIGPTVCLEVGVGSGIVSTSLASLLGSSSVYLATDLNQNAAICSTETGKINNASITVIVDDLAKSLMPRLHRLVDILIFNPPYVVTPSSEVGSHSIEAAWAGGIDGREVIDRFLPSAVKLLSDKGVFYMVVIDKNKPEEVSRIMKEYGFCSDIVMKRKAGIENLMILRFTKSS